MTPRNEGQTIAVQPLTAAAFAEFGDALQTGGEPKLINDGMCERHSDLALMDFDPSGRAGISLFSSQIRSLPYEFRLLERHPLGSQAFLPMGAEPFLVIVAPDEDGVPGRPAAFETAPLQGVNFRRGVWHGVLTPLGGNGLFAVVDWIGDAGNVEIHEFAAPWRAVRPEGSIGRPQNP